MNPSIANRILNAHFALLLLVCGCNALATDQTAIVEVQDEPRHHVVFENAFIRILDVDIVPGDTTLYHRHRRNNVFVVMSDAARSNQLWGAQMSAVIPVKHGDTGLQRAEREGLVHRVLNAGQTRLRFTDIEFIRPTGSSEAANPAVMPTADNEFYRAYQLMLASGETSPSLTLGPGIHVIVAGAQLQRIDKDGSVTDIDPATNGWQWHEAGTYRLRNPTSYSAQIVEIELK